MLLVEPRMGQPRGNRYIKTGNLSGNSHRTLLVLFSLLKEVIQPHVPVRLPCYDFTPVTSSALGAFLQTVRITTLGIASFHGVTGGVYKARERIHRCVADQRLLAIPSS